jgi:PleD family two-component response regulator
MDGLECVRRLRAHEQTVVGQEDDALGRQLIIGISANSDVDTVTDALGVGMNDFLAKPVSMEALRAMCLSHGFVLF